MTLTTSGKEAEQMTMYDDSRAADDFSAGERGTPESERADAKSVEEPRVLRGMPVFGRDGTRLGELTRDGDEGGVMVMRRDLDEPELTLPDGVVTSIEAAGIYTRLTWSDLDALLPPPAPGSSEGLRDAFGTGAEAAHANRFEDDEPS
jgi:hypothetical protein